MSQRHRFCVTLVTLQENPHCVTLGKWQYQSSPLPCTGNSRHDDSLTLWLWVGLWTGRKTPGFILPERPRPTPASLYYGLLAQSLLNSTCVSSQPSTSWHKSLYGDFVPTALVQTLQLSPTRWATDSLCAGAHPDWQLACVWRYTLSHNYKLKKKNWGRGWR